MSLENNLGNYGKNKVISSEMSINYNTEVNRTKY